MYHLWRMLDESALIGDQIGDLILHDSTNFEAQFALLTCTLAFSSTWRK